MDSAHTYSTNYERRYSGKKTLNLNERYTFLLSEYPSDVPGTFLKASSLAFGSAWNAFGWCRIALP